MSFAPAATPRMSLDITPGETATSAQAEPSLSRVFAGLAPDWHSDWAWENYEATILALARHYGLRSVCEIGGGRDPLFTAAQAAQRGIDLIVNDIDAGELALTPSGLKTARFDIAGDLSEPDVAHGGYDMMVSRMVFEHIDGVAQAWRNVHALLAPGGVALAFFPTLWAPVFALNHLLPEKASRAIVHALFPSRRDGGGDPKFPALYDWCRGNSRQLAPMLKQAGFSEMHVQPFWGHGYFERLPGLREVDKAFNALAAKTRWHFVTTYAYVLVRKERG
ncbi:methyltransferase domain-containing protein [Bosea sp. (in: a-proteobacteria)]|uniref:class I SAM-dependent methyltransferase n=1 Tax=Bosea sp. (in: a-proteobacteria) TaxID=1871050 RepID=UPI001AD3F03C|nr:methyltransferase domain-containing protein [Bosea sp. (in: a-proteobacteria)]MBN9442756.1 methyltransferase domain-containing protein [Bosea sp. (in: a-proteobacteria)]